VSGPEEVRYELDFGTGKPGPIRKKLSTNPNSRHGGASRCAVSRIARLMALALRFEGLLREQTMQDYAELARGGGVTRARMTQIMKLLDLAPDIQERLLFLPPLKGLNERSLRSVVRCIDWNEQRRVFEQMLPAKRRRARR
jgi:hypothetical protein